MKLETLLDAIQACYDKHPQPFSHIIEKFCTVRIQNSHKMGSGKTELLWDIVPLKDEIILARLEYGHSDIKPSTAKGENRFHQIMELAKKTASTYTDFAEFLVYNCLMSWPSDGDPNDYYRDDWYIWQNLVESLTDSNWEGDR